MTVRRLLVLLLSIGGALSVAIFVGALEWGTQPSAASRSFGALFRGVLYPVLVALAVVLLVGGALELWRRRHPGAHAPRHRRLELIWTAIPVLALLGLALGERELRAGRASVPVEAWLHAGEGWHGAELETPLGRPVQLSVRAGDVAHVLSAPGLGVRAELAVGESVRVELPAATVGEFELRCSVHERVVGHLRVVDPAAARE